MIEKVGVIGAGHMGSGIATVCAQSGCSVILVDIGQSELEKGQIFIEKSLDMFPDLGAEKRREIRERIQMGDTYALFSDCDLIIEATAEDESVKKTAYTLLRPYLKPSAIIATNTSSLSITRLGAATDRPEKFIGMHFMNPAPTMQLVELIRGIATTEETFSIIRDTVLKLGKTPVVSEDFPAFIVNRILLPMINEAIYTLYEGVGHVEAIDTAMKLGANHPMGPLELADFMGLDVCLSVMQILYEGLADSKYRPCPLLVKYVEAGWLGCKTGRGFYDYSSGTPIPTR